MQSKPSENDLSARPDGGPAFPVPTGSMHNQYACAVGLSVRDYFASQIMAALVAAGSERSWKNDALVAYEGADAMLAARSVKNKQ